MTRIVKAKTKAVDASYDVRIEFGALRKLANFLGRSVSSDIRKVAVVSNKKVFGLYGDELLQSLKPLGPSPSIHLIGDGERFKDLRTLQGTLEFLSKNGLSR